jgi:carbonic anhydrase
MGGLEMTDLNGKGPYYYNVNHMHMHGPSEHRLDGVQQDLEIHIVHELRDGPADYKSYKETLAVVAILFKVEKTSHPFIQKLKPEDFGHIERINFSELFGALEYTTDQSDQEKSPFYCYRVSTYKPTMRGCCQLDSAKGSIAYL